MYTKVSINIGIRFQKVKHEGWVETTAKEMTLITHIHFNNAGGVVSRIPKFRNGIFLLNLKLIGSWASIEMGPFHGRNGYGSLRSADLQCTNLSTTAWLLAIPCRTLPNHRIAVRPHPLQDAQDDQRVHPGMNSKSPFFLTLALTSKSSGSETK